MPLQLTLSGELNVWHWPPRTKKPAPAAVGANVPPVPDAPQISPVALIPVGPVAQNIIFEPTVLALWDPWLQISMELRCAQGATSTDAVLTATGAPDVPSRLIDQQYAKVGKSTATST